MMTLIEAAIATGGTALHGNPRIEGVSTDTRCLGSGALYVALKGERFDGHDFVPAALERGAAAVMVGADWLADHPVAQPTLAVTDTRRALGGIAAWWRNQFVLPLIGVTGSNGKTTVKEMAAAILRAEARAGGLDTDLAVLATVGNLNNEIGLPLMLLRLHRTHRAAVLEMGMNHPGEIAALTRIAQPTVAVVTNAQRAHLAGLGSVSDVAHAKGEIFEGLRAGGTAVLNADDAFCAYWRERSGGHRVLSFGIDNPADVSATCRLLALGSVIELTTGHGTIEVTLRVPGMHNVRNALAAAAATLAAGASLAAVGEGLAAFAGVSGRLQVGAAESGALLIDDTYNANPDSVRAAIDVLASTAGRKILVLGDMGEIGEQTGQFHDEVGGYAKSQGVDLLFGLGVQSELAVRNFGAGGRHFASADDLVSALRPQLGADCAVLVKGSRFMRMERVAGALAAGGTVKEH